MITLVSINHSVQVQAFKTPVLHFFSFVTMKLLVLSIVASLACFTFITQSTVALGALPDRIEACETLVPPHNGSTPRNTSLIQISYQAESNGTYLVTVNGGRFFQWFTGFFLQARPASNPWSYQTFGSFVSVSSKSEPFTCLNSNDMIRHADNEFVDYVQARWVPPTGNSSVRFRATVVQELDEILENIISETLNVTNQNELK